MVKKEPLYLLTPNIENETFSCFADCSSSDGEVSAMACEVAVMIQLNVAAWPWLVVSFH